VSTARKSNVDKEEEMLRRIAERSKCKPISQAQSWLAIVWDMVAKTLSRVRKHKP